MASGSEAYSVFRCIHLSGVSTYVQVTAYGTVTWNVEKTPTAQLFTNVTVHNPALDVSSRTGCGRTAGYITRSKADVSQGFYATECSANAGISAGFPWGVSLAPTFSCSKTNVGTRATTYGQNSKWFQNNTGAPVYWTSKVFGGYLGAGDPWPCLDMRISVTLYQGTNTSDSVIWGNNEALHALTC